MKPLLLIGLSQALFALVYFLVKRPRHLTDRVVAIFILTLAAPLALKLLNFYFHADGPWWVALYTAIPFAYGPLLLLYTRLTVAEHPRFTARYLAHFAPLVIVFAVGFLPIVSFPNDLARVRPPEPAQVSKTGMADAAPPAASAVVERRKAISGGDGRNSPGPGWVALFVALASSYVLYAAFIFMALARHRKTLPDFFSSQPEHVTLGWLLWTAAAFLLAGIFTSLFSLLLPTRWIFYSLPPGLAQVYGSLFFLFVFSMFSVKQPPVYSPGESLEPGVTPTADEPPSPRYEKSGLKDEDAVRLARALGEYMEREKPHRDSELNIVQVAAALGVPRHHVTQVLNNQLHENFYTFVNRRRVTEALALLARFPDMPLIRVAAESGFNSKSTFNRVFRAMTGHAPSERRALSMPS